MTTGWYRFSRNPIYVFLITCYVGFALLVPNVVWEINHHWISLDFASSQHDKTAADSPPLVNDLISGT